MGIDKKINKEIKILDKYYLELNELLSKVKPSDKLVIGDTFLVEKDIPTPGSKEVIKKDSIVTIKNIFKGLKGKTDTIEFLIDLEDKIHSRSKGIFIVCFCKDIFLKEEEKRKKIKKLKNKIKEESDKRENKDILKESDKVQYKAHFLLGIAKVFSKKI